MKQAIIAILNNLAAAKLVDSKAALAMLECDNQEFTEELSHAVMQANKARTKDTFSQCLSTVISLIEELEPAKEFDGLHGAPVTELERLEDDIKSEVTNVASGYFNLGNLLKQAKEQFDKSHEFLSWADERFGFKKAYVYRLMQVATKFADPIWHSTPARNLFTLAQQGTEDDIENARQLLENGNELNIANLSILLNGAGSSKPEKSKAADTEASEQALQQAAQSVTTAIMDDAVRDVAPKIPGATQPAEPAPVTPPAPAAATESATESKLAEQLEIALGQIAELTQRLAEATKPKLRDYSEMPVLRQFRSSCYRTRLGLSEEEAGDKATILEAFKEFCKAGYGRQHQEAFALIDEARHNLIHGVAKAA